MTAVVSQNRPRAGRDRSENLTRAQLFKREFGILPDGLKSGKSKKRAKANKIVVDHLIVIARRVKKFEGKLSGDPDNQARQRVMNDTLAEFNAALNLLQKFPHQITKNLSWQALTKVSKSSAVPASAI